jgi:hypothetical protein
MRRIIMTGLKIARISSNIIKSIGLPSQTIRNWITVSLIKARSLYTSISLKGLMSLLRINEN